MRRYRVLSPDGFDIEPVNAYTTKKEAAAALSRFVERYEMQGYYSTFRNRERYEMPLNEIKENCKVITLK